MTWQIQEAKARFSELVQKAIDDGPQTVTRHGKDVAVVLSSDEYRKLCQGKPSLKQVLMSGPDGDLDLPPRAAQERELDW